MDGGVGANNSSDFVRKLYKMLEDPSYSSVVRWSDDGDSFVVLENERFTKSILPKHFKHSNFASFVRQLNKYDFHKVRQNNEEGGTSAYGPNAWEFKHPEFRANSKDTLDNIRRKAPAPRKASSLSEENIPIQQIDLMNQQIVAQAQQIESLSQTNSQLQMNYQMVVQEVLRLQKTVINHDRVMQDVMTFLHSVDAKQRRDSKGLFNLPPSDAQNNSNLTPTSQTMPNQDEEQPASPLQHASKLLNNFDENQFNMALEQQTNGHTTSPRGNGQYRPSHQPQSASSSSSMTYAKMNPSELETVVYPTGGFNGIDPMYGDHTIPYNLPQKDAPTPDPRTQFADSRKRSNYSTDPGWARAPRILLVEDDPTCRQIGGKFLYSFSCAIDTALDGLEAVSKMQEGIKYDMILMDIIMPNLDGVSACHIIRQFDRTPIIAMTSNIRSDDIQMYFQHGMDDVLPKPFTRKSLLEMLEKHLMHLKKVPGQERMGPPTSQMPQQVQAPLIAASGTNTIPPSSTAQIAREDLSAETSPAGSTGTWNSPSQYSGVSPVGAQMPHTTMNQAQQNQQGWAEHNVQAYASNPGTPVGMRGPGLPSQGNTAHRRSPSEMTGGVGSDMNSAQKRQRMGYAQGHAQPVGGGGLRPQ